MYLSPISYQSNAVMNFCGNAKSKLIPSKPGPAECLGNEIGEAKASAAPKAVEAKIGQEMAKLNAIKERKIAEAKAMAEQKIAKIKLEAEEKIAKARAMAEQDITEVKAKTERKMYKARVKAMSRPDIIKIEAEVEHIIAEVKNKIIKKMRLLIKNIK